MTERIVLGMLAGIVAAAATAGAELAFGWRLGDALGPFTATGWRLVPPLPATLAAAVGIIAHVATGVIWGAVFGALAPRRRGVLVLVVSIVVTGAAALVHTFALPVFQFGAGLGGPRAPLGPVVALYILFAAVLAAGYLALPRTTAHH